MLLVVLTIPLIIGASEINFAPAVCPQILGCECLEETTSQVRCYGAGPEKIQEILRVYGNGVVSIELVRYQYEEIDFSMFEVFPILEILSFEDSEIELLNFTNPLKKLKTLRLNRNEMTSEMLSQICSIGNFTPSLKTLSLKGNYLTNFNCSDFDGFKLSTLDLSDNQLAELIYPISVENLDLSRNQLQNFNNQSVENLKTLDLSHNSIFNWTTLTFPKLTKLLVAGLKSDFGFEIDAPKLEYLNLDYSNLWFLDFHKIKTPNLRRFLASNLNQLSAVSGVLPPKLDVFRLTDTKLHTLPKTFFGHNKGTHRIRRSAKNVTFTSKELVYEPCLLQWSIPIFHMTDIEQVSNYTIDDLTSANCTVGISKSIPIHYGFYGKNSIVECLAYGKEAPIVSWYRYHPSIYLGKYDPKTDEISHYNVSRQTIESYEILSGGYLLIKNANRTHIERYVCVAENKYGKVYDIVKFRLDYTSWYSFHVFHSVFWGGLATSLIVCLVSFLLNITWILTRKSALWWIQRAERLSRVRKMVEAMEKYRARQMENLHETYTRRVQLVRDNYHQQVEALRVSYTAQSEKFRDYRAAQMDAVSSHLENLRENYNAQLSRVREYGSKRAEQLWESYERQVNRMRTFSLQHRLKLMRQYKVKQRYLNKLLESFQTSTHDDELEKEEKVRAALEMLEHPDVEIPETSSIRMSRASSFHSLPEYLIDDRGNVQPGIPGSSAPIRFSAVVTSPTASNGSGSGRRKTASTSASQDNY
ncbi:unnamed protein product [Caenorhabditis bovis]|uniref:Ig-like domain-containing protein n=1 Tax=Caenorhabditis bovis TaxID=2654633 RepID=A0A8S1EPI0_9PELO|nr:unnamed protein product [Caenorhabditis bovis]